MLFLWYCFDDWTAKVSGVEWLGSVPWPVVLLAHLILIPLLRGRSE